MKKEFIGIVGVGQMGHGIAKNIQKKGWHIGLLDHAGNQPTDDLVADGAVVYQSLAQLAESSDTIVICVTGSPQVEEVLTRQDGLLAGIRKGSVVIDCSTAIPSSTHKLSALVKEAGGRFLDAPMTRTPKEAAEGRLNLIVGGDKSLYDEKLPLMQAYAENITYAGDVGSGHTLKLLHNYVSLGYAVVLAEAVAAAKKADIDLETLQGVLAHGGGAGVVLDRLTPYMLNEDVGALLFSIANSAKDLGYYNQMCEDYGATHCVAHAVDKTFSDQVANGNGESYVPQLISLLGNTTAN